MTGRPRVVVVGAGVAGLAAAASLVRADVDVRVIEARDRVGGRLWTLRDVADGMPAEGGAMMVHGTGGSARGWIREFGLTARPIRGFRKGRILYEGRLRSVSSLMFGGWAHMRAAIEALWTVPRAIEHHRGPDLTLSDFLAARRISPLAARFVALMYGGVNATDAERLSVAGLAEEADASSAGVPWRNYRVLEGLDALATRRAAALGDRIRLRTRVGRIEWSTDGVRVHAAAPDGADVILADAAIMTVPLGSLKAGDVGFDPPLPEAKRRAIEAIGYGDAMKVLLLFDPTLRSTALGRYRYLADEAGGFFFLPRTAARDGPILVEGFLSGRTARSLTGRPEAEILESVLATLERMVPGADVRGSLRAARAVDWPADPLSRGAYSYPAIGGGLSARRALAAPLAGSLFFAGEATNFRGEHATIQGALDTGERAAAEVLAALRERA